VTESQLQDRARLIFGADPAICLWRNNCGVAEIRGHKIRFGVGNPGGADLLGLFRGRFIAVEIKTATGRQTPEQRLYQQCVERHGGLYFIVRSENDAGALLAELHRRFPAAEAA
jgi:hypothetical protein